jgi:acyl carrier protein
MTEAIAARAARLFGLSDPGSVDVEATVSDPEALVLGDRLLDSMDLVELLLVIEEDLAVPMVELIEEANADTLAAVAGVALAHAPAGSCARFCDRWRPATAG